MHLKGCIGKQMSVMNSAAIFSPKMRKRCSFRNLIRKDLGRISRTSIVLIHNIHYHKCLSTHDIYIFFIPEKWLSTMYLKFILDAAISDNVTLVFLFANWNSAAVTKIVCSRSLDAETIPRIPNSEMLNYQHKQIYLKLRQIQ